MRGDCLIEIGTEELPPRALQALSASLADQVDAGLRELGLAPTAVERFATPRRLAVLLREVPLQQQDQVVERRGPAVQAAFDADGQPTRAAIGFAGSCGVEVDQLERRDSDKGSWLYFQSKQAGQRLIDLLPELVARSLSALPIPRRMRWGDRTEEFVRPVKWLVMMIDEEVVPAELFGLRSGRTTRGHRFHAPGAIELGSAGEYESRLREQGWVIADFGKRRETVHELVEQSAASLGGVVERNHALLDEVTALVEYPAAVVGDFDAGFLALPAEVLVTTMQENQKYFALFDDKGALLPHFISIANIESRQPEIVASGNERVIRPRFADAEFFFEQDRKQGLDAMRARLDSVVFQKKLGSLGDKVSRVARVAGHISAQTGADQDLVRRAAELCKADLMSDMVGEFPRLQGVIGRYYARDQHEDEVVCDAIEQHYWPKHAGDQTPRSDVAQALALADRLDSLVGIFAIGQKPGGDKDPFGLRRAALAVLRIIVENRLALDLVDLCRAAAAGYKTSDIEAEAVIGDLIDYVFDRMRAYYEEQGVGFDIVDSVIHRRSGKLYDCELRILAVQAFQQHEAATALAAANKRISNILKKQALQTTTVEPSLLRESAERELYQQLQSRQASVAEQVGDGNYAAALQQLAELRPHVDLFFDEVMVMTDDEALKSNRLALLDLLLQNFRQIADFSRIQS